VSRPPDFRTVPPGPLADLKNALRGLYWSAQPARLDDIRASIERLDAAVALQSVPARDAINAVLRDCGSEPHSNDLLVFYASATTSSF
jgi:hypothetical protein